LECQRPNFVAVDANLNVYVTFSGRPVIDIFAPGASQPVQTLALPGIEGDGLDFDTSGNWYASYRTSSKKAGVYEFPAGQEQGMDLGIRIGTPQGLTVDADSTIIVADSTKNVAERGLAQ